MLVYEGSLITCQSYLVGEGLAMLQGPSGHAHKFYDNSRLENSKTIRRG